MREIFRYICGVLAMTCVSLPALAGPEDLTVDFLSLRGERFQSGIELFATALESSPKTHGVRAWSVPSTGYNVSRSEIQILYFDPEMRDRAIGIAQVVGEYASNPVCLTHETDWRKEGLGDVNIYVPSELNLDELAGGPRSGNWQDISMCQERRDIEDNWLELRTSSLGGDGRFEAYQAE